MTTTPVKLNIPFIDIKSCRRNSVLKEGYLLLEEKFIEYKIVADYESNDNPEAIWKEMTSNYRWTRPRETISEVEMYFDNTDSVWCVDMDFVGVDKGNTWAFNFPKEALAFYNTLREYFVTR